MSEVNMIRQCQNIKYKIQQNCNSNYCIAIAIIMSSKLFDVRKKLQDLEQLSKYLQQNKIDEHLCQHSLKHIFENKRQEFVKAIQLFKSHTQHNLITKRLKENLLVLDLCKFGTRDQLAVLLDGQNMQNIDGNKRKQMLNLLLQNNLKKNDKNENAEIAKLLTELDPKFVSENCSKILLFEAIDRQNFQLAEVLIQKGADVAYQSPDRQNLLHILMKKYNKKNEKPIMNLRAMLVQKGVDERKLNVNKKRPYELCPYQVQKKLNQQIKPQTNQKRNKSDQNMRQKGKSEQGSQIGRPRNNQYREKYEIPPLKIDSKQQLQKLAVNCLQKRAKQKQKQYLQRQKFVQKSRDKQKRQKIVKRVFTPEELKPYLNQDIKNFIQQIQRLNEHRKSMLNELIQKITARIKQNVGALVRIFGSFATELCLFQSDIDMVIIPNEQKEIESSFKLLQMIANLLQSMTEQVETVKYIKTASVPIIKIQCTKKYDCKKIDITYKDQNHNGLDSVQLIQKYMAIYPQLKSLVFVLKKFIYCTNIYDPYSGGLSSYGLILMIVAYLQNQNRQRKAKGGPDSNKLPTIAELLIGFLDFYGFKCNYISKQICVLSPQQAKQQMQSIKLQKSAQQPIYVDAMEIQFLYPNDWQPRAKLTIIDPLNPSNNIGRTTHKIRQIKTAFEMAYVCIHTNKTCKERKNCQSFKRISGLNLRETKYENYKRPCCIIKRMLNSTKSFLVV